jgi:hypothetical protein
MINWLKSVNKIYKNNTKKVNQNRNKLAWPENTYLINQKYKLIYCPIPKVACSSLKELLLLHSNLKNKEKILANLKGSSNFHIFMSHNFSLSRYSPNKAIFFLTSEKYFKFVVVRNPWSRLLSAYIDKFIKIPRDKPEEKFNINIIAPVIDHIYNAKGLEPDYNRSINFHQFVEYVCSKKDNQLNEHWKTQSSFLGDNNFDLIAKLENLSQDFELIEKRINCKLDIPKSNKAINSNVSVFKNQKNGYAFLYPNDMERSLEFPSYEKYYTPYLIELVREKYKKDIENFGYDFYIY